MNIEIKNGRIKLYVLSYSAALYNVSDTHVHSRYNTTNAYTFIHIYLNYIISNISV